MDALTHGLLGALAVQAARRGDSDGRGIFQGISRGRAVAAGTVAALFPDIDYLLFWLDPLQFLADWHRGLTHSLVMLPLWALLLGTLFAGVQGQLHRSAAYSGLSALGILSHIAIDLPTAYGIQLFAPLSHDRFTLSLTYVVDPYVTAIVLISLAVSLYAGSSRRAAAQAGSGLLVLILYLGLLAGLQQQALELGIREIAARGLANARSHALPQPFSPLNWKVIIESAGHYRVTHVHLIGQPLMAPALPLPTPLSRLATAYHPVDEGVWIRRHRFGDADQRALATEVWRHPAFEPFRRFARFAVLERIDHDARGECVWFTDLRYTLPGIIPFFRYGLCRATPEQPWQRYRLRRHQQDVRQRLSP